MSSKIFFRLSLVIIVSLVGASGGFFPPTVVFGDDVTVSATVAESITCSTAGSPVAFGTLTTGAVAVASPNATTTMSCNNAAGCTLNVQDTGAGAGQPGLYKSVAPTDLIASASATLSAGTEGYGIQAATTTAGTGETLNLSPVYNKTGDAVGGMTTTAQAIATSSAPVAGRLVVVTHKAAISGLTAAGSYTDTITYGCVGN